MKRYKLLKNLPFAKAGTIFRRISFKSKDGLSDYDYLETNILLDGNQDETVFSIKRNYFINNFDEWFEEIKEPEQIYYVDNLGGYASKIDKNQLAIFPTLIANLKSTGNYFETRDEAEKYLKYLKAKVVIKRDTKGFKPDWENDDEKKYLGFWDFDEDGLDWLPRNSFKEAFIYFKSREDIEESLKNTQKNGRHI